MILLVTDVSFSFPKQSALSKHRSPCHSLPSSWHLFSVCSPRSRNTLSLKTDIPPSAPKKRSVKNAEPLPGCTSITFWTNRWRLFRSLIVGQFLLTCPGQKAHEKQRRNEFHCFVCTYKLVILWSFMIILFVNCTILFVQLLVLQLMFYSVSLAYMFRLPTLRFLLISFSWEEKTVLQGNHSSAEVFLLRKYTLYF